MCPCSCSLCVQCSLPAMGPCRPAAAPGPLSDASCELTEPVGGHKETVFRTIHSTQSHSSSWMRLPSWLPCRLQLIPKPGLLYSDSSLLLPQPFLDLYVPSFFPNCIRPHLCSKFLLLWYKGSPSLVELWLIKGIFHPGHGKAAGPSPASQWRPSTPALLSMCPPELKPLSHGQ